MLKLSPTLVRNPEKPVMYDPVPKFPDVEYAEKIIGSYIALF